jgi:hypothetical protein
MLLRVIPLADPLAVLNAILPNAGRHKCGNIPRPRVNPIAVEFTKMRFLNISPPPPTPWTARKMLNTSATRGVPGWLMLTGG